MNKTRGLAATVRKRTALIAALRESPPEALVGSVVAAQALGVHPVTLRKWAAKNDVTSLLPARRTGRRNYYSPATIVAYLRDVGGTA